MNEPKPPFPLTDDEVRELGYEPTERGWVPSGVLPRARLTFVCAAGKHAECYRPTCTCECHGDGDEGGTYARRPVDPAPVVGVGQASLPEARS